MNFATVNFLFLGLSVVVFSKNVKLFGGELTIIQECPYLVSLRSIRNNKHGCGGAIISNRHILTAAHCVFDYQYHEEYIKIYAGISYLHSNNGNVYSILKIIVHPKYTGIKSEESIHHHDISILVLRDTIIFNDFQKKIDLPTRNINYGDTAVISGWGSETYPEIRYTQQVHKASMTIISHSKCRPYFQFHIQKEQICVFEKKGLGACIGDSGNPLIHDGKIIGIASFIVPCATGVPDVYTKVYDYLDFIQSIIEN